MAASMQGLPMSNISNLTRIIRLLSSNNQLKVQSRASSQGTTRQKHIELKDVDIANIDISQVVIPKKIHREPTAILRALSATVEKDTTGPDFLFVDDPYLNCFEHHSKKKYTEALVAGRRAARYIIDHYPTGFNRYRHYPERVLPTCEPKPTEYKFKNPCEEALIERIRFRKVNDALMVYDFLLSTDDKVSSDTKLDLLDLLCVYNCKEPPIDAIYAEKLFSKFYENVLLQTNWREHNNPAEKLFKELPKKPARAYNTLLQGRAEYGNTDGAQSLYDEMISSRIPVDEESYNKLIQSYSKKTDSMQPIKHLLTEMEGNGVRPTVKTFEAVLSVISWAKSIDKRCAIEAFHEMKKLGIEPNLTCFRFVLDIVYKPRPTEYVQNFSTTKRYNDPRLINQVLDYLNDHYVLHEDNMESYFLTSTFCIVAMMIVSRIIRDVEVAAKIVKFYEKNANILSDRGGFFYNNYMSFLIDLGDIHYFMKEYKRIVPYTTVMKKEYIKLFPLIELTEEYHYLLDIWDVFSITEHQRFEDEIKMLINVVVKQKYTDDLQSKFCGIADTLIEIRKKSLELFNEKFRIRMSAEMVCKLIQVYLHGNQLDKAWNLFVDLSKNRKNFHGMAMVQPLSHLASTYLEEELIEKAMGVITFMGEEEMPISSKIIASIDEIDKKEASRNS